MKKILLIIVLLAAAAVAVWWYVSPEVSRVSVQKGRVTDITPMLRLCSVEIFDEIPVRGTVGSRHMFAKMAVNGSITFDLDKVELDERGDTLLVTLPPEIVEIYESTEPDSYQVIDVWNDKLFGSPQISTTEENRMKGAARRAYRNRIYEKGYVSRARLEAVSNLTAMLTSLLKRPVVVTDPTPHGINSGSSNPSVPSMRRAPR